MPLWPEPPLQARPATPRRAHPRYLDDLPVAQVADLLDRTVHATEAWLVRARTAFRQAYSQEESGDA
ncbi:MAG: hypothetical protein ACHQ7M_09535 [Chloroflexota bacterium]